jgi:hypothetical protein
MKQARTAAVLVCATMMLAAGASSAAAVTVSPGTKHRTISLVQGQSLKVNARPVDSPSSGYHWRVTKAPKASVLRFVSSRTSSDGKRQVLTFESGDAGVTSLKLQYVPPGRGTRGNKTFSLTVAVSEREPFLLCGYGFPTEQVVAQSSLARVFKIRRTAIVRAVSGPNPGALKAFVYDAYYGCEISQDKSYPLVDDPSDQAAADNAFANVTLRGTAVGYVLVPGCRFAYDSYCERVRPLLQSRDLHTGRLIRSVGPASGMGNDNSLQALVVSPTGGLVWIEHAADSEAPTAVVRSDAKAQAGEPFAADIEYLDSSDAGPIDPESLGYDGTDVTWLRGGELQRAPLR